MVVIVLAGGLGTRLRSVVSDVPKVMAPVNGKPFLEYVIEHLEKSGIDERDIILSCGYKSGIIKNYFSEKIICTTEPEPKGTGGAVAYTLKELLKKGLFNVEEDEKFLVVNGDTFLNIPVQDFLSMHEAKKAMISIAMVKVPDAERYCKLEIDANNKITNMLGRGHKGVGYITGGIFAFSANMVDAFPEIGALEEDVIEKFIGLDVVYGFPYEANFIDIGIPEDYERSKTIL